MSKRAEEAALKAYPTHDGASEQWKKAHLSNLAEYIQGYEQAEKDLILRTKRWISEIHRICDITDEHGYRIELRDLVASFEKTIKDE